MILQTIAENLSSVSNERLQEFKEALKKAKPKTGKQLAQYVAIVFALSREEKHREETRKN